MFMLTIFSLGMSATRLLSAAWDVGQVIYLGVEEFARTSKELCAARHAINCYGRFWYIVLDRFLLVIDLLIDIATLLHTLYDMSLGSKSKPALELEKKVNQLEAEQKMWAEIFLQD